jgi:glycerol uptake facilitator-like aquaporin
MYLAEFTGTFVLIFLILFINSISNLSDVQNAICIGIAVTFSILLCKLLHYNAQSHFNPVVSTVSYINYEIKMKTCVVFILLQVFAALLSYGLFTTLKKNKIL